MISDQLKAQQKLKQHQKITSPLTDIEKKVEASLRDYDLTKWKYAQLRDTINTSCGML